MNKEWFVIISKRFLKMFLIGGFGSIVVYLASNPITDLLAWQSWGAALVSAFLIGGISALEKWTQGYNPQ
jgi:hypothetical protein